MACNHPLKGFWTGNYTENGKKEYVVFPSTAGDVVSASLVERKGYHISPGAHLSKSRGDIVLTDPVPMPCGKCIGCRMKSAKDWKVRLVHEAERFKQRSWFITLTYDDDHLPVNGYGEPILVKEDLQKFLKRLRTYTGRQFRYFACGEYGSINQRPHYHLILFGDLPNQVPFAFNRAHDADIAKAWKLGLHEVSAANENTMAYVAGYVEKKAVDPMFYSYAVKPFHLMSRKPLIGSNYVPKLNGSPDRKVYGNFGNVNHSPIPKAYLKKCESQSWYAEFKAEGERLAKMSVGNRNAMYGTNDEDLQGFIADNLLDEKLTKLRREKL